MTITTDIYLLIASAVLLVLAIVTPLINIFFRKIILSEETEMQEPSLNQPKVSVLLTVHDNARDLQQNLPALLSQYYPTDYEVVVVVSKGEDETDDVLKQFVANNKHLYVTFIPDSSRYMSRKKLAITLGVKAAKYDWILLVEPTSKPVSDQWLYTMARNCQEPNTLVMGCSQYNLEDSTDYQRFEHLITERYLLREAQRGTAYRALTSNLMFRKQQFLQNRGFEGNLKYIRGEYDFLVNKTAEKGLTATETDPKARLVEQAPTHKQWRNHHLYYMETRQHLKRKFSHRIPVFFDQLALHLNFLLILAAIIYAAIVLIVDNTNTMAWILGGVAILSFVITIILRTWISKKAIDVMDAHVPAWKAVPYECSLVWRHLYHKIRYAIANKNDFISHKV